ncbi:hypothetical protein ONS95_000663 [Cadophora gregata]|uniref:uncharacterized protein n=1 Tax=Cadophora gregata TaxID=51156 RepID=UPI0026DC68A5|nr:uncharacterized protein ONS95_000663 [Cadophora gregata]KAK0125309.1 hypothetical protein ONS96_009163 [Cadophora gregata f. sp. sojae]KAK0128708.1 hypothetical protein ONS95_000663 [Cadophora gregata]
MGWLWSSSAPATSSPQQNDSPITSESSTQSPPSTSNAPPSEKLASRDDLAEQELAKFLQELDADIRPSSTKYNRVPRNAPSSTHQSQTQSSSSQNTDAANKPLAEQLLPTTMSCRTAFDEAFYCNSFGGRWNDLYRYGTLKSCSDQWNNFWFCMRTRTYGDKQKEAAVREHYRQRESSKYSKELGKESSEDVWKSRDKKVEWGEAFIAPFPGFSGTDEEWRQRELDRRRGKVDGSMG